MVFYALYVIQKVSTSVLHVDNSKKKRKWKNNNNQVIILLYVINKEMQIMGNVDIFEIVLLLGVFVVGVGGFVWVALKEDK